VWGAGLPERDAPFIDNAIRILFKEGWSMTETEYLEKIDQAFVWIESRVDAWNTDHDLSIETGRHGPVLETEFESGQQIIVNAQAPTQQLWLASIEGAHHFVCKDGQWMDTRGHGAFEDVFVRHARLLASLPGLATG
jgi:CyaY protein